jgi:hypothetical protein
MHSPPPDIQISPAPEGGFYLSVDDQIWARFPDFDGAADGKKTLQEIFAELTAASLFLDDPDGNNSSHFQARRTEQSFATRKARVEKKEGTGPPPRSGAKPGPTK